MNHQQLEELSKKVRHQQLEELSEKVRNGEPIGFLEAIAVVEYQSRLQAEREAAEAKTFFGRIKQWFRS